MIQELRQRAEAAARTQGDVGTPGVLSSVPTPPPPTAARTQGDVGVPGVLSSVPTLPPPPPARIKSITVLGLPQSAQNEVLAGLPVREGDLLTPENRAKILAAARQFDEHLSVNSADGHLRPGGRADRGAGRGLPPRIRVGGNVQSVRIVKKVTPVYPPLAKQARIQGIVVLSVIIGKDGKVQNITVDSGHALLVQPALDAVRQWEYQPTLLNGEPVEVSTTVEVNFTLSGRPTAGAACAAVEAHASQNLGPSVAHASA